MKRYSNSISPEAKPHLHEVANPLHVFGMNSHVPLVGMFRIIRIASKDLRKLGKKFTYSGVWVQLPRPHGSGVLRQSQALLAFLDRAARGDLRRDLHAVNENALDFTLRPAKRLVGEIEIAFFRRAKPRAPISETCRRIKSGSFWVTMMILDSGTSRRMIPAASAPFIRGMDMSIRITSGRSAQVRDRQLSGRARSRKVAPTQIRRISARRTLPRTSGIPLANGGWEFVKGTAAHASEITRIGGTVKKGT